MTVQTPPPSEPLDETSARDRLLLTVLCIPMFLVLLDVLAMNIAMPTVGRNFGVPVTRWPEVINAYTIPLALAVLPGGWLVDRLGPRQALLLGNTLFTLASGAGALTNSWSTVIGARVGQGFAAAVMLPAGLAALSLSWPDPSRRARALGSWSSISAVASALGPAVGGIFVGALSWRAIFWVNIPLSALAVAGTWQLVEPGRVKAPGEDANTMVLRGRAVAGSVAAAALMTAGANGTLQVVTVHLQSGLRLDAIRAGAFLLLSTVPFMVIGPWSGQAVVRFSRRTVAVSGFVAGACGLLTLGRISGTVGLVPGLLGIGVGLGLMTSAIVGESLASWPARPGLVSGLNNALRQVGTSVGVAFGGWAAGRWTGTTLLRHTGVAAALLWAAAALIVLLTFARSDKGRGE